MAQQSKSYRYGKQIAPYKQRIVVNNSSNGSSFFRKMKSFFSRQQSTNKTRNQSDKESLDQEEDSLPKIPGGFFVADTSSVKLDTSSGRLQRPEKPSAGTQSIEGEESGDESEIVNTSNAKLAEFFSKKGDQPLTDIEMEGVLSLMRKASRSATPRKRALIATDFDDSTTVESSRVLKSSRTPSMAATYYKAPSFTPGYEDSIGSQSLGNASLRSTSSRRRVFDYSSFPTPYKTVVYKYSAADGNRFGSGAIASEASSNGPGPQADNSSSTQRLSNTASALVSLLDGDATSQAIPSLCSNPYSSYIEPIRQYKKKATTSLTKPGPTASSSLRSEALEKIQDAKDETNPLILPKQRQRAQQKPPSDKYKPARSSSLRSSIVPVEEVSKTGKREEEKATVPTAAHFSFSFQGIPNEKEQAEVRQPDTTSSRNHSESANTTKPWQRTTEHGVNETDSGNERARNTSGKEANPEEYANGQIDDKSSSQSKTAPISVTSEPMKFDFGEPLPSNVDAGLIDGAKVEEFRSLFAF